MPPREVYRVEAITKSDDPEDPGWAYFLELWTETGPARLHIEGEIVERATGQARMPLSELARIVYYRGDTLPPDLPRERQASAAQAPSAAKRGTGGRRVFRGDFFWKDVFTTEAQREII